MTTKDFFDGFSKFLSEDEITKAYANSFKSTLMDQSSPDYQNKLFTRTGYRVALIFFDQYGKKHKEFEDPECFKAHVDDWNNRDIEKIKNENDLIEKKIQETDFEISKLNSIEFEVNI